MKTKREVVLTVENAKKETGVHYTTKHTGKMAGMQSLSTSCLENTFCQMYAKDPQKICSHCYAQNRMKMYPSMQKCLRQNTEILTGRRLSYDEIPLLNAALFRFESFGDIQNEIQVINYFNICYKNPHVNFALWTKNPGIIKRAIEIYCEVKPVNLQIVLSSHFLNIVEDHSNYDFIDKVFTVYDQNHIDNNNIEINCGARSCLACRKCYFNNGVKYINEKLK